MKHILILLACLLATPVFAASSLTIAAGDTYTITPEQQRLSLASLRIGDGAKVVFAEGVNDWYLRADQAAIGRDVVIDGRGGNGADGADGGDGDNGGACENGRAGVAGVAGDHGGNGVSMRLQLGLTTFGNLRIVSDGGSGGSGGQGGNGSASAAFDSQCNDAPKGGDAGAGGNGGQAGSGGNVTVMYWPANGKLDVSQVANRIQVSAAAGAAGRAGKPGQPGPGSEGRYVQKKTLAGSRAWVGGGDSGRVANAGVPGSASTAGEVVVEQALVSIVPSNSGSPVAATPPATAKGSNRDEEVQAIKQELRSLLQRLDELETQQ